MGRGGCSGEIANVLRAGVLLMRLANDYKEKFIQGALVLVCASLLFGSIVPSAAGGGYLSTPLDSCVPKRHFDDEDPERGGGAFGTVEDITSKAEQTEAQTRLLKAQSELQLAQRQWNSVNSGGAPGTGMEAMLIPDGLVFLPAEQLKLLLNALAESQPDLVRQLKTGYVAPGNEQAVQKLLTNTAIPHVDDFEKEASSSDSDADILSSPSKMKPPPGDQQNEDLEAQLSRLKVNETRTDDN